MRNTFFIIWLMVIICFFASQRVSAQSANQIPGIVYEEKALPDGTVLVFLKIDPAKVDFRCFYENPPMTVNQFAEKTKAPFTVNAGYWDKQYRPTDLLVVQGKTVKTQNTKNSHSGLFFVKGDKADVRDIRRHPILKSERFDYAVKCGPTLVLPGGLPKTSKSVSRHARLAVGKDKNGFIIFLLNKTGRMTYEEFTAVLLEPWVNAEFAFNLDGGPSVGYELKLPDGQVYRRRSQAISSVICAYPK